MKLWQDTSGTAEITELKMAVSQASHDFDVATAQVTTARRKADETLLEYERVSSHHTSLLQHRDAWTETEANEFPKVVAKEVSTRQVLQQARQSLQDAEQRLSHCQLEYMNAMRRRYHEEQIWQDKWRILGIYGTWSLIVLNSAVFLLSQYFYHLRERNKLLRMETMISQQLTTIQNNQQQQQQQQQQALLSATGGKIIEDEQEVDSSLKTEEQNDETPPDLATDIAFTKGDVPNQQMNIRQRAQLWVIHRLPEKAIETKQWLNGQFPGQSVHVPSALVGATVATFAVIVAMTLSRS